jgi:hypothetical protein
MTIEPKQKKRIAYMAIVGAVLALVCHFVPPKYQAVCNLVASICSGGIQ